jgi:hypothetical protein
MSPLTPRVAHRRWLWGVVPATLVVVLVLIYVFLDLLVAFATQAGLDRVAGVTGYFAKTHVTIIHPGYDVYRLTITQFPNDKGDRRPLLYADKIEMRWSWRGILHGHLVRAITVFNPTVVLPMAKSEDAKPAQPPLEIAKTLESVPSAGLQRLAILNGQITLVDEKHDGQQLWLHHVEMTIENVASRKNLMHGLPVLVTLRAVLQRSGALSAFLTLDPFDEGYTFAASLELHHQKLTDLYDWTKIKGLSITRGTIDAYATLDCKRGKLTGGIKPLVENVHVDASDDKFVDRIKAKLIDVAAKIFSDRVPGRHAVGTIIPIHGDLSDMSKLKVETTPAILAVVRNAFVEGLSASLSNTPPPNAKHEGFFKQAVNDLSKKAAHPVKAHTGAK